MLESSLSMHIMVRLLPLLALEPCSVGIVLMNMTSTRGNIQNLKFEDLSSAKSPVGIANLANRIEFQISMNAG